MGFGRTWTPDEVDFLQDRWGISPINEIAKKLDRTINSIMIKKNRLGLGKFLESSDYITFNQLLIALGVKNSWDYKMLSWIKNRNFPLKYKKVNKCRFKIIYLADFWKWAEKNRNFLDFSKFEENMLGKEPSWVKDQRKISTLKSINYKHSPWTSCEDEYLKSLLKQYKYSYYDLSKMLQRTNGAIQRRICDLGFKERPLRADNHVAWTDKELRHLQEMIISGYDYESMSDVLCKSSKAIRGQVYRIYGTEVLDKARLLLNKVS